jgi:N-carbamoylputrescine amidase
MARIVKGGLIQASRPLPGTEDTKKIKKAMIEEHVSMIEEVRRVWQFFRDRRPETYDDMCKLLP